MPRLPVLAPTLAVWALAAAAPARPETGRAAVLTVNLRYEVWL